MTIAEIEAKAKSLASARQMLSGFVTSLNEEIEDAKRRYLHHIKNAVNRAAQRHEELRDAIEASPELFESPRTVVLHGIKLGYRKGAGGIDWDDDERTADLIKKHLPKQFDVLVKTTRKPQKKALSSLDVADLKRIGCTVEGTSDVVVIKATDSEVDKIVTALLKGAVDEAQKEAE